MSAPSWAFRSTATPPRVDPVEITPREAVANSITELKKWSESGPPGNQRATAGELAAQLEKALPAVVSTGTEGKERESQNQETERKLQQLQDELRSEKAKVSKLEAAAHAQQLEKKREEGQQQANRAREVTQNRAHAAEEKRESKLLALEQQAMVEEDVTAKFLQQMEIHRKREVALAMHLTSVLGPVSTMCRVRPPESYKNKIGGRLGKNALGIDNGEVTLEEAAGGRPRKFKVDRVLDNNCSQEDAIHAAAPWVSNVIQGGSSCIFAYGATGAGKTYTLQGESSKGCKGLAHYALERLISEGDSSRAKVRVTMLEVYCDEIRDLLATPNPGSGPPVLQCNKRNPSGQMVWDSVDIVASSFAQAENILTQGYGNRATEGTLCNERSSRSHVLLFAQVVKEDSADTFSGGRLVLVDLAGSENIQKSGADSDRERLKEAQFINKSLSCLADVVHAAAKQQNWVPYRNSRLTMLLEESLTNAKVLLLVHVSPLQADATNTCHSLQFAGRARAVDFGAQKRAQDQVDSAKAAEHKNAQLQIQLDNTKRELEKKDKELEKKDMELKEYAKKEIDWKQQNAQQQEQMRTKSAGNPRGQENQPSRPHSPHGGYQSRHPTPPTRQRRVATPPAKKAPSRELIERTPFGDLTNSPQTSEQKLEEAVSDQSINASRDSRPSSPLMIPRDVPVYPVYSPNGKSDAEDESSGERCNEYDGKTVRSILRRLNSEAPKSERKNPDGQISFSESPHTAKSPPQWYLDGLAKDKDLVQESHERVREPSVASSLIEKKRMLYPECESSGEENRPRQRPTPKSRPGTPVPRARRDAPVSQPAARWRS